MVIIKRQIGGNIVKYVGFYFLSPPRNRQSTLLFMGSEVVSGSVLFPLYNG